MIDYEIQRATRRCAQTGRELQPGDTFYSTLSYEGPSVVRRDYSAEAWQGPPEGVVAWWKSQVPARDNLKKVHWAPNDVMLDLLESLESESDKQDLRYVLALLLIRRRVVRLEAVEQDPSGREVSLLYCPRREAHYRVPTCMPTEERTSEIQNELARLLVAETAK